MSCDGAPARSSGASASGHTLQPTALVHEVYLRLVDQDRAVWQNRAQFLAIASEMMRRILVDRARARKMAKRSGAVGSRHARRRRRSRRTRATLTCSISISRSTSSPRLTRVKPASPNCGSSAGSRWKRPARARHLARDDDARLAGGAGMALQASDAPAGSAERRFLATRRSREQATLWTYGRRPRRERWRQRSEDLRPGRIAVSDRGTLRGLTQLPRSRRFPCASSRSIQTRSGERLRKPPACAIIFVRPASH